MKSSTLLLLVLGVSVVLGLALIYMGVDATRSNQASVAAKATKVDQPLQGTGNSHAFSLPDLSGKIVSLADYRGKVVLLNFWATWCGPCRQEIPDLMELYKDYKDQGLEILGLNVDQGDSQTVRAYVEKLNINYKILLHGERVAGAYGVSALPTSVIIDRQGNVQKTHVGFQPQIRSILEAEIKPRLY